MLICSNYIMAGRPDIPEGENITGQLQETFTGQGATYKN
jgi:hypothetical protein